MAQLTLIDALMQYLVTVTALTDLVSSDADTNTFNIRPGTVTQGTATPYITIQQLNDEPDQVLSGVTSFTKTTFSFNIVSDSTLTNAQIANTLRQNLDGYQRRLLPETLTAAQGAIWVNSTRRTNGYNFPNSPQTGDQHTLQEQTEIYDISIPLDDNVVHPPETV